MRAPFTGDDELARHIADASPDALVVIDGDRRIAFVNQRFEAMFGYTPDEVLGQPLEILLPERLRGGHPGQVATYARSPEPRSLRSGQLFGRRRDGSELPVEILLSPIPTPRATYLAASVRDVTERHAAETVLRESEERFRLAFEGGPIGMAVVGLDGRFLRVNRSLCAIVGYEPDELVARRFQDITHADDLEADSALADSLLRGDIPSYQLAKRYIRKDGSSVHVMLSGTIARDESGAPLYFLAQVEDITARRDAEAALRRSEAQLRELVEQAPEPVFVADLAGRYTNVNSAAARMLGYAPEELIGKTIVDLIPPEDVPKLAASRELMLVGGVHVSEWTLQRKDGVRLPVEVSAKIHGDGRWVAFVRDMSERKRSEEALRRSRASLARAQRVAHLGSWDWDLRTNEEERSDELLALFGLSPGAAESVHGALDAHIHPDDRERVRAAVEGAVRDGRAYALEHRIIRSDGAERVLLQQAEPAVEGGRTVRVVGTVLDITERRRAELEREASLTWLRGVFEQSPVGLLMAYGPRGERVVANSVATQLIGRPLERIADCGEMVRSPSGARLPDDALPVHRALGGEHVDWTEYLCERPDGIRTPILVGAAPIRDAAGNVDGAIVAVQDITAAKELERLRSEWASVVAHELRQPLNAIVLFAQVLLKTERDTNTRRSLERISAAGQRLERMIGDLMDLSSLDARRLELSREPLDVVALLRESVARSTLEAPTRPVDLRVHGDIPSVLADPDRVVQVVDNLLGNAVKYGAAGTRVTVDVEQGDGVVAVAVTNEGRGISAEDLPTVFERFRRATAAKAAGIKGTGLGLYIARELVEAHGGQITVESTPGGTTTFRFTLPTGT